MIHCTQVCVQYGVLVGMGMQTKSIDGPAYHWRINPSARYT